MIASPRSSAKSRPWIFTLAFVSLLAILVGNLLFLYQNMERMRDHEGWVAHTHEVLSELALVGSAIKDTETGQRGFLINSDETYLEPYYRGAQDISQHIGRLRGLLGDNPAQLTSLTTLETLSKQRIALLEQNIKLRRERGLQAVISSAAMPDGKARMDALRALLQDMQEAEQRLLRARDQDAKVSARNVNFAFGLATVLNVVLLSAAYFFIARYMGQQRSLVEKQEEEAWINSVQAEASARVSGDQPIRQIAGRVLDLFVQNLAVQRGSFYLVQRNELELVGSYGGEGVSATPTRLRLGEGLAGEAAVHGSFMHVTNVPESYFPVHSSLGQATPRELLVLPFVFEGAVVGVVELASFLPFTRPQLDLARKVREVVGIGLNSSQSRAQLQMFLEETQRQSEELQAQQEELRQNNEELEQQTQALESQRRTLSDRNLDLESARREIEDKASNLERTSQYKSEFLAKMSHELRTPLNSMLILSTLLMENKEATLTEQQRDFAQTIHTAGNDLLTLINDILDLSKIEARKLELHIQEFDLSDLAEQLRKTFGPMASAKGVELEVERAKDFSGAVRSDRQRLEQVLRNFLSNAIKFTEHGKVTLELDTGSDHGKETMRITVRDTGIGIPESKRKLIFEAFEQADSSTSRTYGGTGLGLTISRELAALLGGSITVESEVGKGSAFTIEIPRAHDGASGILTAEPILAARSSETRPAKAAKANDRVTVAPLPPPGERTILIVEDDPSFGKVLTNVARDFGFHPILASDGEAALETLKQHSPHAILLDVKLPGISGLSVLERIKSNPAHRHIPTHVISMFDYAQNALKLGAVGYLPKPTSHEGIREAFERIEKLMSRKIKRVLIVEDDQIQREAMEKLVSGADIETLGVSRGQDALDRLNHETFDCVVVDLNLPDMSGFELLEQMNSDEHAARPPVVVYTGKDLTKKEEERLRKYSESIIIKGAKSPERLLDEVSLFLHRVEAELPADKREMLAELRRQEKSFEGRMVLLVDDDLRNIFALTSALESKGLAVVAARNGVEALAALEKHPEVDLVLMDIMMPQMDGYEAMRRIRAQAAFKNLPMIALTAKAMKGDHEKCLQAGANDYLPKPINLSNLMSLVRVWLAPPGGI